jgi:hydroxymethyl cephem carbamoyltransferase
LLILGVNGGHDGAVAVISDGRLLFSVEAEKDSFKRHGWLHPTAAINLVEHLAEPPDVIALGGWGKDSAAKHGSMVPIGAGYEGGYRSRETKFLGRPATFFTSSHERSHIAMAVGMAPRNDAPLHAVLVWEGYIGTFYLLDSQWSVQKTIQVMRWAGHRYAFVYSLANAAFPDDAWFPDHEDAGKLMALAAYGDPDDADTAIADTVERIINAPTMSPVPKAQLRDSPVYNAGVEAEETKIAAALLTRRLFEIFAEAAKEHIPEGLPLYISGGCGLNCDWNVMWRELGHFSSVFVPPCTDDSGSALGTAIDAQMALTGSPHIDWNVYSGLEFEWDLEPNRDRWRRRELDLSSLADSLRQGQIVAWVQGRWEIGPRALGARSLLAEPFDSRTRDRLNEVKQREGYRPVAPCCRLEDAGALFTDDSEDPYMLYFRHVRSDDLGAVTHVDGTTRAQTVTDKTNARLYDLLTSFEQRSGAGILCNTSLNFKGAGFINNMSDLVTYCESRGVPEIVVGDAWFSDMTQPDAVTPSPTHVGRTARVTIASEREGAGTPQAGRGQRHGRPGA